MSAITGQTQAETEHPTDVGPIKALKGALIAPARVSDGLGFNPLSRIRQEQDICVNHPIGSVGCFLSGIR
jgi:hypothetical protein